MRKIAFASFMAAMLAVSAALAAQDAWIERWVPGMSPRIPLMSSRDEPMS